MEELKSMSLEELTAARENATDEEKAMIDEEIARRQQEGEEGGSEGGGDEEVEGGDEGSRMKSEGADGGQEAPYGSQVLAAAFEAISTAAADIRQATATVEQPDARGELEALIETLDGARSSLGSTYAEIYPDAPSLEGAEQPVEATDDAAVLKSFVAIGRDRQARTQGVIGRLDAAIRMSPVVSAAAAPAMKSLREMLSSAKKSFGKESDEMKRLRADFESLKKTIGSNLPGARLK